MPHVLLSFTAVFGFPANDADSLEWMLEKEMTHMKAPHIQSVDEVLVRLQVSRGGLSTEEAATRLRQHGPNELRETISRPAWRMLLAQFIEPLILILVAAAVLSFFLGDLPEGIAILAIVLLFGVLGFLQEYRAEKAMARSSSYRLRRFAFAGTEDCANCRPGIWFPATS